MRAFLIAISGIIVGFGHPTFNKFLGVLSSCFGFALFWIAIWPYPRKKRCLLAFIWFTIIQSIQLSWMTATEYHGIYILIVYALLSILLGAQFSLFTRFFPKKQLSGWRLLSLAGLWTLFEWIRLFVYCGFPFNPVGISLTCKLYSLQFASIGGMYLLSFWVMLSNLLMVKLFLEKKKIIGWGLVCCLPYIFGFGHVQYHKPKQKDTSSYAALIQTGLRPEQKAPNFSKVRMYIPPLAQWKAILSMLQTEKKIDLVILPEMAVPFDAFYPLYSLQEVKKMFKEIIPSFSEEHIPKSAFSTSYAEDPEEVSMRFFAAGRKQYRDGDQDKLLISNAQIAQILANCLNAECIIGLDHGSYNAAFHFLPGGNQPKWYAKRVLVPLAEYLPISFLSPLVGKYGIFNFFTHGEKAKIFKGKYRISPSICYEECYGYLMREGRIKGANLFVNVTNDNFFPSSGLSQFHFDHGKIRAIENGVPLLRACNTGITSSIDALGRVENIFELNREREWSKGALIIPINQYNYTTLYLIWGDWFIILGAIFFVVLGGLKSLMKNES